jgi:methionine-S-sulfoxide reductase
MPNWFAPAVGLALAAVVILPGCGRSAAEPTQKPPMPEPATVDAPATQPAKAGAATQPGTAAATQPGDAKGGAPTHRTAVFAGGCYWCVEAVFQRIEGVQRVVSGFAGGRASTAVYSQVVTGRTQHAESVRVTYDPDKVTYGELLQIFFATHDPTQLNRQGPDVGTQYRSTIFYANPKQKQIAERYIEKLDESDIYQQPIVTTVEALGEFYPAKESHQNYAKQNPDSGYIETYLPPKLKKLRKLFGDKLKESATE